MLDCVVSEALRSPTSWELAQYASAPKADRNDWAEAFDLAYSLRWDEAMLQASEARAGDRLFRRMTTRPNTFRGLFRKGPGAGEGDSWFDANYYVVDGVSGKVSDWVDYIDPTHTLRQATSANQVAAPSADAAMSSALSATFAGGSWYDSNRSLSLWKHDHDGTGCNVFSVLTNTSSSTTIAWSTRASSALTETGATLSVGVGAGFLNWRTLVGKGAGGTLYDLQGGAFTVNSPFYTEYAYAESVAPKASLKQNSVTVASGSSGTGVSSGNPDATLRLGAGTGGLVPARMKWRARYDFRRVLSAAHRTIVQQWIQRETGIAP